MSAKVSNPFLSLKKNLYFINDLRDIEAAAVLQKIKDNTAFSVSYIVLLSSATIVCTLGLLLNSAPIVIGGMLISPLMWPLMKISIGVSFERRSFIIQALYLLILSIAISLACSMLITFIVPLRIVTNEILSRTTPTLLDIFVAIAAGSIAAFSVIQKKISDSLAGVAIATSLMPPLCVSGIGFVLGDYPVAIGGFFLFFTNIISIIFISLFIFSFVGIKRDGKDHVRTKGIFYIILVLILTSIPLINSLKNYSFKLKAYQESKKIISNELYAVSPELSVKNISTSPDSEESNTIVVEADIISPENINLDYTQKEKIVTALENELNKKIKLNLRIQKTISLRSQQDIVNGQAKNQITDYIETKIAQHGENIILGNIESSYRDEKWQIVVVMRAEPGTSFREVDRQAMQDELGGILQAPVSLTINLVPLLSLTDENGELSEQIKHDTERYVMLNTSQFDLTNVDVIEQEVPVQVQNNIITKNYIVRIWGSIPVGGELDSVQDLKDFLTQKYQGSFVIEVTTTEVNKVILN